MSQSASVRAVLALAFAVVVIGSIGSKAAELWWCQDNPGCLCIAWASGAMEVRCRSGGTLTGWVTQPGQPPDGSSGSWQGSGRPKTAPSPLPGNPLFGDLKVSVDRAKNAAILKLRGEKVDGVKGQWLPNRCTDLFANNPLGMKGGQVLAYITFRDGTGVKNENNQNVCASGSVAAWTKCCQHDPIVYICPSQFLISTDDDVRTMKLIHEALHVAGQFEDNDGSVGPGDPPNATQIDELVRKACDL